MGKVWVKELTGGLDTRRMAATTPGGVLIKAQDGHINSGGEIEKRAAFVAARTLPAGTVGLAADSSGLIVFGSDVDPGVPAGVTYQRLEKSTKVLVDVPSWDRYGGLIYSVGEFDDGTIVHYYDATEVADWFDGRARVSFRVVSGSTVGSGELTDLTVNGVSIIGSPVAWDTDPTTMAAAIAAEINGHTSSPDYDATSVGDTVNIIADAPGAASNGFSVFPLTDGDLVLDPTSGLFLGGGADSAAFVPGLFVKTLSGRKIYATAQSRMHFSGIDQPTKWTTDAIGAGSYDVAKEASGAEELLALASYQGLVAAFAESVVLIFFVDPDPDLINIRQILQNTGTVSPRSVTEFGDTDVFYVALSGLRSLRARDSTNSATTTDLGVPIDSLVTAKLQIMSTDERKQIIGLINPIDGRFWLIFPDGTIFVFSFYSNSKVSAWTTYVTGFPVSGAVVWNRRVWLRSGDTVYVYGGEDSGAALTYDSTTCKVWLPFFDAGKPTEKKQWEAMDAAVEGTWALYAGMDVNDQDAHELVATVTETTFNNERIPFNHGCSHVSPRFESSGPGPAKVSSWIGHYQGGDDS
jgi:hypothetical protein